MATGCAGDPQSSNANWNHIQSTNYWIEKRLKFSICRSTEPTNESQSRSLFFKLNINGYYSQFIEYKFTGDERWAASALPLTISANI